MIDSHTVVLHLMLSFEEYLTGYLIVVLLGFLENLVDGLLVHVVVRRQALSERLSIPMPVRTSVMFVHARRRILNDFHATVGRVRRVFALLTVGMPNIVDVFAFELRRVHRAVGHEFMSKELHAFVQG